MEVRVVAATIKVDGSYYLIQNILTVGNLLSNLTLKSYFDIKGIGRLKIDMITTIPTQESPTYQTQRLIFHCIKEIYHIEDAKIPAILLPYYDI